MENAKYSHNNFPGSDAVSVFHCKVTCHHLLPTYLLKTTFGNLFLDCKVSFRTTIYILHFIFPGYTSCNFLKISIR